MAKKKKKTKTPARKRAAFREVDGGDPPPTPGAGGAGKLRLEYVKAGSLSPNPRNWRTHPPGQMAALRKMLDEEGGVGFAGALLYNQRTQRLIDGHARRDAVDPDTYVPVLVGDWDEHQEKQILLTLDPIGAMAGASEADLRTLMAEVDLNSDDMRTLELSLQAELAKASKPAVVSPGPAGGSGAEGGGGSQAGGNGGAGNYKSQYGVIVIADNEAHQQQVYEALHGQGYNCKVVVT